MNERRDDWAHGVDENLASLNAGQRIWEREMVVVRQLLGEFDHILRGDPDKDTDGVISRMHHQETEVNLLKAVVLKDGAGNKGLAGRVEDLESGERTSDNRWKFATAVVVAVLSLFGLLVTNWGRIESFLNARNPIDQSVERAVHSKARRRHVIIRETPTEQDPES